MKSRLEDLLATADRQLAAGSYEAAIDNYRTALGEPGAGESEVQAKLDAACRTRDEAHGIAPPPVEAAAPPVVTAPLIEEAIAPTPPPPPHVEQTPIEPPTFQLLEDHPALLESTGRTPPYVEAPPISILHTELPPETPGDTIVDAIASVLEFFS